jgi:hypothetical protein
MAVFDSSLVLPDAAEMYVGDEAPSFLFLERAAPAGATGTAYDPTGWPTQDQIQADAEWDEIVRRLQAVADTVQAERDERDQRLAEVSAAVERAAAPVTGALPRIVPLTKADAHDGAVEAVITHACERLREIARTRRTSELIDVIASLEAVI